MKRCTKCQAEYPDDANWCRFDGGRLEPVAAAPARPQAPGPGALTMGWDAQPDVSAEQTNPSMAAPHPTAPAPPSPAATTPMKLAAAAQPQPLGGARMPQKPSALTMGWDAQPEPPAQPAPAAAPQQPRMPQKPSALTMG
ncbi:MAG TPA: hypothetical protein VIV40_22200, partial [Kofleriaceae bacterium]